MFPAHVEKVGQWVLQALGCRLPSVTQASELLHRPAPSFFTHQKCVSQCSLQTGGNKEQSRVVVRVICDSVPLTLKNLPCASWQAEPASEWHGASGMGQVASPELWASQWAQSHPLAVLPSPRTPAHSSQSQEWLGLAPTSGATTA